MSSPFVNPGPDADHAFRLGMIAVTLLALVGVAVLYWTGYLTLALLVFSLLLGLPIYLVLAASALSVWLGFDKDATDLRPVYREEKRT